MLFWLRRLLVVLEICSWVADSASRCACGFVDLCFVGSLDVFNSVVIVSSFCLW